MKYWMFVQKIDGEFFINGEALPLSAYLPIIEGHLVNNHYGKVTGDPINTLSGLFDWINLGALENGMYVESDSDSLDTITQIRTFTRFGYTATITKRGNHLMPFWWVRNVRCMNSKTSGFYRALVSVQANDEWQKNVYLHPSVSFPLLAQE